jgi:hypothetical protein
MCPDLSDEWVADAKRRRRIHIFGPVAWYVAVALSAAAIVPFFAAYVVILLRLGGSDAWPVAAIVLASIGFVIGVPAALAWLSRRTRSTERVPRHSAADETEHTDAWLGGLAPQHDPPERVQGYDREETDYRVKRTRFQWVMVLAFILVVLGLMLLFRLLWIPDFGMP